MAIRTDQIDADTGFSISGFFSFPDGGFGSSVSIIGDLNSDGIDDLVISAPGADRGGIYGRGESYVIFGQSGGFDPDFTLRDLDGTTGFRISGTEDSFLGSATDGGGDFNGDGVVDLLVGGFGFGALLLFGGAPDWDAQINLDDVDPAQGLIINTSTLSSVALSGDLNGDGYDDAVVYRDSYAHVHFGGPDGLPSATIFTGSGWAASVDFVGDINGDGIDDLALGSPGATSDDGVTNAGQVRVIYGSTEPWPNYVDAQTLGRRDGFILNGGGNGDVDYFQAGISVSAAGDVNGDGIDDMIVGSRSIFDVGAAYVVFGRSGGFPTSFNLESLDGTTGFRIFNDQRSNSTSFQNVSAAGDVNGDGFDDIIVSDQAATTVLGPFDVTASYAGAAYVLYGTDQGFTESVGTSEITGARGFTVQGHVAYGQLTSVSGGGDVNADGFDDVVLGFIDAGVANSFENGPGATVVIYGNADLGGVNDAPVARNDQVAVGTGIAVDLAADHGNGRDSDQDFDDLSLVSIGGQSVGALGDRVTLADGLIVTYLGGMVVEFALPDAQLADSVRRLITYTVSDGNGGTDRGYLRLELTKSSLLLDGSDGPRFWGLNFGDRSGAALSSAGDINGDGLDDFVIGALLANPSGQIDGGEAYVMFGNSDAQTLDTLWPGGLDGSNGFRVQGATDDLVGYDVAGVGDVNDDGFDDVIVTARGAGHGLIEDVGEAYLIFGASDGFAETLTAADMDGTIGVKIVGHLADNVELGQSVAAAGDINGDGIADFVISDQSTVGDQIYAGRAYVVFGDASGFNADIDLTQLSGSDGFALAGIASSDQLGEEVAAAGDVNGDGFDDLIVSSAFSRKVYIVYGSDLGFPAEIDAAALDGTNGFSVSGLQTIQASVSGVGDFNGDGFDDFLIGDGGSGSPDGKSAFVVFGTEAGFPADVALDTLDGQNGFQITQSELSSSLGFSTSSAGDFNNDGLDDLLIGAYLADPGAVEKAGEAYIIFGTQAGMRAEFSLTDLDGINGFVLEGADAGDRTGHQVASAGDINGDGYDDVLIGAYTAYGDSGITHAVYGWRHSIDGSDATDRLTGTYGSDTLDGMGGRDVLRAGNGNDTVYGSSGFDRLFGENGDDLLFGGEGNDQLLDGAGTDEMAGDSGNDRFILSSDQVVDYIMDFEDGSDIIDVRKWSVDEVSNLAFENLNDGSVQVEYLDETLVVSGAAGASLLGILTIEDFVF